MTVTTPSPWQLALDAFTPREATLASEDFPTPGALARALDPLENLNPPHLQLLDDHLVKVANRELLRLLVTMPPQEGKSTRAVRYNALWLLKHNPDLRIAIVSFESERAIRWGRFIRDDIERNDLGIRIREDVKAAGRWQIDGHRGSVYCTGWQGSLTGEPVDLLIVDDPVKDAKSADSPSYRDDLWDWWLATARARLGPDAPVVLIMTRWHQDDIAGRLLAHEGDAAAGGKWTVLRVPAIAEADDPIGRAPGEWLPSARGRTVAQWQEIRAGQIDRWWNAQYQGRPTAVEGAVWRDAWIDGNERKVGELPQLLRTLVMVDVSGSSATDAAETGIVVVSFGGDGDAYVLDDRSLRATPGERYRAVCEAAVDNDAHEIVVEADFGGDNLVPLVQHAWAEFVRTDLRGRRLLRVPTIRAIKAAGHGSKRLRAEAAAGWYQAGRVHHVVGGHDRLAGLRAQMLEWTGEGASPDRIDALAHGVRELLAAAQVAQGQPQRARWAGVSARR